MCFVKSWGPNNNDSTSKNHVQNGNRLWIDECLMVTRATMSYSNHWAITKWNHLPLSSLSLLVRQRSINCHNFTKWRWKSFFFRKYNCLWKWGEEKRKKKWQNEIPIDSASHTSICFPSNSICCCIPSPLHQLQLSLKNCSTVSTVASIFHLLLSIMWCACALNIHSHTIQQLWYTLANESLYGYSP